MSTDQLKVTKTLHPASLWIHPIGWVMGSMFLGEHSALHSGPERPREVLNNSAPFLVLRRDDIDSLEFYAKHAIVRVEYPLDDLEPMAEPEDMTEHHCEIRMMDGSLLCGTIKEYLPADQARLFDYLNRTDCAYVRLIGEDNVTLINKDYMVQVTPLDQAE